MIVEMQILETCSIVNIEYLYEEVKNLYYQYKNSPHSKLEGKLSVVVEPSNAAFCYLFSAEGRTHEEFLENEVIQVASVRLDKDTGKFKISRLKGSEK